MDTRNGTEVSCILASRGEIKTYLEELGQIPRLKSKFSSFKAGKTNMIEVKRKEIKIYTLLLEL
jgi:adenine-specific DNA methylase